VHFALSRAGAGLLLTLLVHRQAAAQRLDPYEAEGIAFDLGRTLSLQQFEEEAARRAKTAATSVDFGTVAELYKRLGNPLARQYYERAIAADPSEPGWEVLYATYLRLYRGAGQRPLFFDAQHHLAEASRKLDAIQQHKTGTESWDDTTTTRVERSRAALYERDGVPLVSGTVPWLFAGFGARVDRSAADIDQPSDHRQLSSFARFSAFRGHGFTADEYIALARTMSPRQVSGRLRARGAGGPTVDLSWTSRRVANLHSAYPRQPLRFNDFSLGDIGITVEQPFTLDGSTDALIRGGFHAINREGLIENQPLETERIKELQLAGAVSRYLGPDRLNLWYAFARQRIEPEPVGLAHRSRFFNGATATYQIFRALPLPGRDFNTGTGRRFETRGIDLSAGFLDDQERFPDATRDVVITRRDYFVGAAARGLGRFDLTLQPTWYSSRASNDPSQENAHLRLAGSALVRILDEERTPDMPTERLAGLPVAFTHVVVPFHWDTTNDAFNAFRSWRLGAELWTKLIHRGGLGILVVGGYSRQTYPELNKSLHLARAEVSFGF
jgi:hypothetical protein